MERGYFVWAAKMGLDGGSVVGKWKSLLLLNYDVYARFSFNLAIIKMCQPRLILPTGKLLTISLKKKSVDAWSEIVQRRKSAIGKLRTWAQMRPV